MTEELPWGAWPSPITSELVVSSSVSLGMPAATEHHLWWSEGRPDEGGRVQVVVKRLDAEPDRAADVLPDGFSARTLVHEYGGVSYWTVGDTLLFANQSDQRLYRIDDATRVVRGEPPGLPVPITPEPPIARGVRYADLEVGRDGTWFVCVRETHRDGAEPVNELVRLSVDGAAEPVVLVSGPDFVSNPRLSNDERRLAWLQWSHPDMPWDGAELWTADIEPDGLGLRTHTAAWIAGGDGVAVAQPEWSPKDRLFHVSDDVSGYWNIWADDHAVHPGPFEAAQPQWVFGQSWYARASNGRLFSVLRHDGRDHLRVGKNEVDTPYTAFDGLTRCARGVAMVASSFTEEPAIVQITGADAAETLDPDGEVDDNAERRPGAPVVVVHRPPRSLGLGAEWISVPEHLTFPTTDLGDGAAEAHAFFYPPTNPAAVGPAGTAPPLLVLSHGGPTASARPTLNLNIQFWTSRGFAVADVNYRGSTGYGRAYRDALHGRWGIADVDDCIACVRHLAASGRVDPERVAIRGGSAGGFTTLCALVFHDDFRAGSSLYGVGDLETLATDTHKFESRYLDSLIGPYPERRDLYVERSPIHHLDGLGCPIIIFQGLEDTVVPPSQAEEMVAVLRAKGLPFAYLPFEGEQHGFRQAANIRRVLDAEHAFFAAVFGFALPPGAELLDIENLSA